MSPNNIVRRTTHNNQPVDIESQNRSNTTLAQAQVQQLGRNPLYTDGITIRATNADQNFMDQVKSAAIYSLQNPSAISSSYSMTAGAIVATVIPSVLLGYLQLINQAVDRVGPNLSNINPEGQYSMGAALVDRTSVFCTADYIQTVTERSVCEQSAGLIKEIVNNGWVDEVADEIINGVLREAYDEIVKQFNPTELDTIKKKFEEYSGAVGVSLFAGIAGYAMGHALTSIIIKDTVAPLLVSIGDHFAGKDDNNKQVLVKISPSHQRLVSLSTFMASAVGAVLLAKACSEYIEGIADMDSTTQQSIAQAVPYMITGALMLLGNFGIGALAGTAIHNMTSNHDIAI